jgi:tetratricopeptide (TPR) repeat protein
MEITLTLKPAGTVTGAAAFVVRLDEESSRTSVSETLFVQIKPTGAGVEAAGFAAFKRGNYNQAIASFEKVVAAGRASKDVYFSLGLSYFRIRNQARCLASMLKSSGLGNNEAKTWLTENTSPVQITTVTYKQIDSDPFEGYSSPVGLGVLPIADSLGHDTPLTAKLYNALKAKNETLRIFPFSTIKSEQASWGLSALDPSDQQILTALEKDLSMNFAVRGVVRDRSGSAFSLDVIRCKDGAPVITQEFHASTSSTAIEDAVMFLLKGRVPLYTSSRTLEVKLP